MEMGAPGGKAIDEHGSWFCDIKREPDDTTCGPTCLHADYRYYDDAISLQNVISETLQLAGGGTLAV